MASTILVADDDHTIRVVLDQALGRAGFDVQATDNGSTLWNWVEAGDGDLVITDVVMPDVDGLDLLPRIKRIRPNLKIIVMSAQSTLMTAIKAAERGAFEYIPKPFDLDELLSVVDRALTSSKPAPQSYLGAGQVAPDNLPLIGRSLAMQEIYRTVARMMTSNLTVMINGESGTGKELVARALHDYGKRRDGPFVAINMAAIPRELVESELFGHEKGAFTGATAAGIGRFRQAQRGTLFLDEIGDMPLDTQTRLLRVLQEGEYSTVGGRSSIRADVRIVAATHHDLHQLIRKGQFREDLFYRLNVVPIRLPPLRERTEDIPDLIRYFLDHAASEGLGHKSISRDGLSILTAYSWPGNVRELENLIRRIAALYTDEFIGSDIIRQEFEQSRTELAAPRESAENLSSSVEHHLSVYFDAHRDGLPSPGLYDRILREIERPLISLTLSATSGNQLQAAKVLGLNRNTLRKKIRDLQIEFVRGSK